MKLTRRKYFKFYRSYYDVYNMLEKKDDKIKFLESLLDKQFLDKDPVELKGNVKMAYISQLNSIEQQVKGWQTKTGQAITDPEQGGMQAPAQAPALQEKEKEKDRINYKTPEHEKIFKTWLKYREEIKKPYKSDSSIQSVANKFNQHTIECCNYVVDLSISNQWQGLFWDKYTEQKKTPNTRKTINRSDFFTD